MGTVEQCDSGNRGYRGTEGQQIQKYRGRVGTVGQWNRVHRGTIGSEEQWELWLQRNSHYGGTAGTEEQRDSGNRGCRGTVVTQEMCTDGKEEQ